MKLLKWCNAPVTHLAVRMKSLWSGSGKQEGESFWLAVIARWPCGGRTLLRHKGGGFGCTDKKCCCDCSVWLTSGCFLEESNSAWAELHVVHVTFIPVCRTPLGDGHKMTNLQKLNATGGIYFGVVCWLIVVYVLCYSIVAEFVVFTSTSFKNTWFIDIVSFLYPSCVLFPIQKYRIIIKENINCKYRF